MDREAREFWRQRRREMLRRDRQRRGGWGQDAILTKILILVMAAGWLLQSYAPGILAAAMGEGGVLASIILSTVLPGGFFAFVFAALFVWIIGSQVEAVAAPWQYLLVFFGGGAVGAVLGNMVAGLGAGGLSGSLAAFALAGAYVRSLAHVDAEGAVRWAVLLLAINVVLSGFQPGVLAGMAGAFGAGLLLAMATRLGGR